MSRRALLFMHDSLFGCCVFEALESVGFLVDWVESWPELEAALIAANTLGVPTTSILSSTHVLEGGVESLLSTDELLAGAGTQITTLVAIEAGHEPEEPSIRQFMRVSGFLRNSDDPRDLIRQLRRILDGESTDPGPNTPDDGDPPPIAKAQAASEWIASNVRPIRGEPDKPPHQAQPTAASDSAAETLANIEAMRARLVEDPYDFFGLDKGCGPSVTRRAYLQLVERYHTELFGQGDASEAVARASQALLMEIDQTHRELNRLERTILVSSSSANRAAKENEAEAGPTNPKEPDELEPKSPKTQAHKPEPENSEHQEPIPDESKEPEPQQPVPDNSEEPDPEESDPDRESEAEQLQLDEGEPEPSDDEEDDDPEFGRTEPDNQEPELKVTDVNDRQPEFENTNDHNLPKSETEALTSDDESGDSEPDNANAELDKAFDDERDERIEKLDAAFVDSDDDVSEDHDVEEDDDEEDGPQLFYGRPGEKRPAPRAKGKPIQYGRPGEVIKGGKKKRPQIGDVSMALGGSSRDSTGLKLMLFFFNKTTVGIGMSVALVLILSLITIDAMGLADVKGKLLGSAEGLAGAVGAESMYEEHLSEYEDTEAKVSPIDRTEHTKCKLECNQSQRNCIADNITATNVQQECTDKLTACESECDAALQEKIDARKAQ